MAAITKTNGVLFLSVNKAVIFMVSKGFWDKQHIYIDKSTLLRDRHLNKSYFIYIYWSADNKYLSIFFILDTRLSSCCLYVFCYLSFRFLLIDVCDFKVCKFSLVFVLTIERTLCYDVQYLYLFCSVLHLRLESFTCFFFTLFVLILLF